MVELADTVDSKSTARKGIAVQVRLGVPIQERLMLKILIAEDEALIRLDLQEALSGLGFEVVAAVVGVVLVVVCVCLTRSSKVCLTAPLQE